MAKLLVVPSFSDHRGILYVLEQIVPFEVKRVYYIKGVPGQSRGGHRHHRATQALVCVHGSCNIYNHNGQREEWFNLDDASKCLIVEPADWHLMSNFSEDSVLLVLASTPYDLGDYIDEPYPA
jgi:dTDP-4-dehydrorhamnose 3,5-epimerase-like enzyme